MKKNARCANDCLKFITIITKPVVKAIAKSIVRARGKLAEIC